MKPGLAILPLEVWADVSEHPLLTRQLLAQIADNNGDPAFTEKLQKLLHGCGKHSLRFLQISSKQPEKTIRKRKIPECRASLAVSRGYEPGSAPGLGSMSEYVVCKFPETEMPENIKKFNKATIGHFDDRVLDFLGKIKPLFTKCFSTSI